MRGVIGAVAFVLTLDGVVFFGQGVNLIHGSSMTGHGGYAVLGGALVVIGVGLLAWSWRSRTVAGV